MNTISGLLKPKEGKIHFKDEEITGLRPDQLVRKGIALVPEGRAILTSMTVLENLEMGAYHRNDNEVKDDLEKVMDRFPILRERKSQLGGTLSDGQQQMLAIASIQSFDDRVRCWASFQVGSNKCLRLQGLLCQSQAFYY